MADPLFSTPVGSIAATSQAHCQISLPNRTGYTLLPAPALNISSGAYVGHKLGDTVLAQRLLNLSRQQQLQGTETVVLPMSLGTASDLHSQPKSLSQSDTAATSAVIQLVHPSSAESNEQLTAVRPASTSLISSTLPYSVPLSSQPMFSHVVLRILQDGSAILSDQNGFLQKIESGGISVRDNLQPIKVESLSVLANQSGGLVVQKVDNPSGPKRLVLPADLMDAASSKLVLGGIESKSDHLAQNILESDGPSSLGQIFVDRFRDLDPSNQNLGLYSNTINASLLSTNQVAVSQLHDGLTSVSQPITASHQSDRLTDTYNNITSSEAIFLNISRALNAVGQNRVDRTSTIPAAGLHVESTLSSLQSADLPISDGIGRTLHQVRLVCPLISEVTRETQATSGSAVVGSYHEDAVSAELDRLQDGGRNEGEDIINRYITVKADDLRESLTEQDVSQRQGGPVKNEIHPSDGETLELPEVLQQILPADNKYSYALKSFSMEESDASSMPAFQCVFSISVCNGEEFASWLHTFETNTQTQFNIRGKKTCDGRYVVFKQYLKCHHNVQRGTIGRHKHTGCLAKMIVTIRPFPRRHRLTDPPPLLCEIDLLWKHNHSISTIEVLRHQRVIPETQCKLVRLFHAGFMPRSALACLRMDIEEILSDSESLEQVLANRALFPDYRHCHYLFKKVMNQEASAHKIADVCEDEEDAVSDSDLPKRKRKKKGQDEETSVRKRKKLKANNKTTSANDSSIHQGPNGDVCNKFGSSENPANPTGQVLSGFARSDVASKVGLSDEGVEPDSEVNVNPPQNPNDSADPAANDSTSHVDGADTGAVPKRMKDFIYEATDVEKIVLEINERAGGETCIVCELYDEDTKGADDGASGKHADGGASDKNMNGSTSSKTINGGAGSRPVNGVSGGGVTSGTGTADVAAPGGVTERVVRGSAGECKYVLALCLPFMRRVHEYVREAGETVFIDSMGGFGREGYRVVMMMSDSPAGVLPLAIGITPSESVSGLTRLLTLFKRVLPGYCFYRRGVHQGPATFITDDSSVEQEALRNVWPLSRQYLCQWSVLRSMWRWLLLSTHGVQKEHRPLLYSIIKMLIFYQTESDLLYHYDIFCDSALISMYPNFKNQIVELFEKKRQVLCCAYRHGSAYSQRCASAGRPTGDYSETCMRIMKDYFFHRTRTFNLIQMLDFLKERFCGYYERRLLHFICGTPCRNPTKFPPYANQLIVQITDDIYEVSSDDQDGCVYSVNTSAVTCTCTDGTTGKPCKHAHYVFTHILPPPPHIPSSSSSSSSQTADGKILYLVAVGAPPGEEFCSEAAAARQASVDTLSGRLEVVERTRASVKRDRSVHYESDNERTRAVRRDRSVHYESDNERTRAVRRDRSVHYESDNVDSDSGKHQSETWVTENNNAVPKATNKLRTRNALVAKDKKKSIQETLTLPQQSVSGTDGKACMSGTDGKACGSGTGGKACASGITAKLEEFSDLIKSKFEIEAQANSSLFSDALTACIDSLKTLSSASQAAEALRMFGKTVKPTERRRKR